jgi:hypothetical protein
VDRVGVRRINREGEKLINAISLETDLRKSRHARRDVDGVRVDVVRGGRTNDFRSLDECVCTVWI